jgi:hypothetical protein
VSALPPFAPAVNEIVAVVPETLELRADGAEGTPGAIDTETADELGVTPALLTALSITEYVEPLDNPVIVTGLAVTAGLKALNVDPPSVEY